MFNLLLNLISKKQRLKEKMVALLYADLSSNWLKLEKHSIERLNTLFVSAHIKKIEAEKQSGTEELVFIHQLISGLQLFITDEYKTIRNLQLKYSTYTNNYQRSPLESDKRKHILEFSKELGATPAQLEADKKALQLWFGHDAITDRFHFRISEKEKLLTFSLTRLSRIIIQYINIQGGGALTLSQWNRINLESFLIPLLAYNGDKRVKMTAFKVMLKCVIHLDKNIQPHAFSENILRYIYRSALDHHQDTWIQTEALELLSTLSAENFRLVFLKRFSDQDRPDDIFIKHHAILLLEKYYQHNAYNSELMDIAIHDASPYVRQAVSHIIPCLPLPAVINIYQLILFNDPSPQVRGALLLSLNVIIKHQLQKNTDSFPAELLSIVIRLLESEKDPFVLHILLDELPAMIKQLAAQTEIQQRWLSAVFPALGILYQTTEKTTIKRWTAKSREWIWCYCSADRMQLLQNLQADVIKLYAKDHIRILHSGDNQVLEEEVSRLLSLLAQQGDGFDLEVKRKGFKLYKKPLFVFRWWRALYEFRFSSIDKRQAYPHTIGRLSRGKTYIPSNIKAELSMTKVPGEPFYLPDEDGWRPFLPLVDDIISLLDPLFSAPPVKIVTADGITHITPPSNLFKRMAALSVVVLKFDHFARLRNWQEGTQNSPDHYIKSLEKLGINFNFKPHDYPDGSVTETESSIQRFFSMTIPLPFVDFFANFKDYFYSVYENNLNELLIFLSLGAAYFTGHHVYVNNRIKKARNSMGIVIGGWGTRGKSGTERLKAALFNALGFNIISKTSGCEAMFLHSYAYGNLREMFLFRPYDKATIWEQGNVLRFARNIGTDVFLWECMGLTPSYVEILQRQWMQDDIATITNTYPDHEDLQGPAGHNIPEVMTQFIPKNSVLISSEEQMLPILRKEAVLQNTRLVSVGWKEAGLITEDVLERFPYDEHPYNIALVLSMAKEFDISEVYALKEMADRVVPDLGVLKTYPTAHILSRKLTFVMGMSANERYGALGNWTRMGFDQFTPEKNPELWISVLINNRADRIPRSRVFADLLVNDISVDAIYLIGTNLHGFMGYLKESWKLQQDKHTLDVADKSPQQVLEGFVQQFRIPSSEKIIYQRLCAMLKGLGEKQLYAEIENLWSDKKQLKETLQSIRYGDAIITALEKDLKLLDNYQNFIQKLDLQTDKTSGDKLLDKQLDELLWQSFKQKITLIENEHAAGDDVINTIVNETPPGLENKIMGMQNIKGTGLDFVYRWLYWDFCYTALQLLSSDKEEVAQNGLKQLVTFQEYSVLCVYEVKKVLHLVKLKNWAQRESIQAELELIENSMQNKLEHINSSINKQDVSSRWKLFIINFLEEFWDSSDAIKRRKKADLIYNELINLRISHARAAVELKVLNSRQKGGWLLKKLTQ